MKSRIVMVVVAVSALVLSAVGMAQAVNIYSEPFDTEGGLVADYGWFAKDAGAEVQMSSGLHGWTTYSIDGDTMTRDMQNKIYKMLVTPTTGKAIFSFDAYAIGGQTGGSGCGFSYNNGQDLAAWWYHPALNVWYFDSQGWTGTYDLTTYGPDQSLRLSVVADMDAHEVYGLVNGVLATPVHSFVNGNLLGALGVFEEGRGSGHLGIDLDNFSYDIEYPATSGTLSGDVELRDYTGDPTLLNVKVDVMSGQTVVAPGVVTLASNPGHYEVPNIPAGTYEVVYTTSTWLRHVEHVVVITAGQTTTRNVSLINGDLNGNNLISTTDLSIVLKSLDQGGDQ